MTVSDNTLGDLALKAAHTFRRIFEEESPPRIAFAPGRVNLIGDHVDYVGGQSLPVTVDRYVVAAFQRTDDRKVSVYSETYDELQEFSLATLRYDAERGWLNYIMGVYREAGAMGQALEGARIALVSNLPVGSGLSSSAALEAATMVVASACSPREIDRRYWVNITHRAENRFVGIPCGLLDQTAIINGDSEHALVVNFETNDIDRISIPQGAMILVGDTATHRPLGSTPYSKRRLAAEEALRKIKKWEGGKLKVSQLTPDILKKYRLKLPTAQRIMAEHVVAENASVEGAVEALRQGNHQKFGEWMNESHKSLKEKVLNTTNETEAMRNAFLSCDGVYGARLTGAGFGGCVVAWVDSEKAQDIAKTVRQDYRSRIDAKGDVFAVKPAAPAGLLNQT